jgi:hypothetical protein
LARSPKPSGQPPRGLRKVGDYGRREPTLEPRAHILIVCEGSKTEPTYFEALRKHRRLFTAEVEICGPELGTHPRKLVECAVGKRDEAKAPFDEVWCVFDEDEHERIHEVLDRARALGFRVAYSLPCFEIWYLLHYRYSSAYIERDAACSELEECLGRPYNKADNLYDDREVRRRQAAARRHAQRLRRDHRTAGDPESSNPSTTVDLLVARLNKLARR